MAKKKMPASEDRAEAHPEFTRVVQAFGEDRDVKQEKKKGFGSGAVKVKGKIFAMMSSKGQFVVKLPKQRVDELVRTEGCERFDPGRGRVMKEWLVVPAGRDWVELAKEACKFVRR
jgi:hypothetical protein